MVKKRGGLAALKRASYIRPQRLSLHGGVAGTEGGGAWRTVKYGKKWRTC